ncbi:hypothetical protein GFS31_01660 [Leptolyngbya sp. BL0902]|uniref:alpha/beta fold hydrolase n=1 Tax=Leptolyngbya sp. BL0902 TaxID=1115757 RepID=UPI0018E88B85|nr:alpha/beta hydrolase [Leptolyngbya sp. BL0902]QQE63501.1 hypothetical protein GFS31_01660 [Leptolyngbya sp. BL0902]
MSPDYLLFAQHGWADNNQHMVALAQQLATDATRIIAPSLNYAMTWLRMAPLVEEVEQIATKAVETYPDAPLRIVGHSMGGLIWLEVLTRHPDWWPKVEFLVLVASPVGGADLGRIIDPLQVGVGIAADLGQDRRAMASAIAERVNTLVIAGNLDGGSDGTITLESAKVPHAQFVDMEGLSHATMRDHPWVIETIRQFWQGKSFSEPLTQHPVIEQLRAIPGMTDAHLRDLPQSEPFLTLEDDSVIRVWRHPLGIDHVFVTTSSGACLYAGYVGWLHRTELWHTLTHLKETVAHPQTSDGQEIDAPCGLDGS